MSKKPTSNPKSLKSFRPISWSDSPQSRSSEYLLWSASELGRLGLDHEGLERTAPVLSELMQWRDEFPNEVYAELVDWRNYDLPQLAQRLKSNTGAKPRIEIAAEITSKGNLSVRWYPLGYFNAVVDVTSKSGASGNAITDLKFEEAPDFNFFMGDDAGSFRRASNELMFIRGVGNLHPDPHKLPFPYPSDALDATLICAVRAAYEELCSMLQLSFQVTIDSVFKFRIIEEKLEFEGRDRTIRRVIDWRLDQKPFTEMVEWV